MKQSFSSLFLILMLVLVSGLASAEENASNPLAAVNNTDLRFQYFDLDGADRWDGWIDGAYMLTPKLKLKYELHYWDTNVFGASENGLETFHLKPILFPHQGKLGEWGYRLAVGGEWIVGFGNEDKGIGTGSDQLGPLVGVAFSKGGTTLVPLVQQFMSYSGPDLNQTAFRLIAIQSLPDGFWLKLDTKVPVDWENNEAVPMTSELQLGKMFSPSFGIYADGLFGIGGDRPYDWGVGLGIRVTY